MIVFLRQLLCESLTADCGQWATRCAIDCLIWLIWFHFVQLLRRILELWLSNVPSMLWHCWLGSGKGIRPIKKLNDGLMAWLSVWARCRLAYGPADTTVSCFSKIQIGFAFLVPAHPGCPRQRAVKWMLLFVESYFVINEVIDNSRWYVETLLTH